VCGPERADWLDMSEEIAELALVRSQLSGLEWLRLLRVFDDAEAAQHAQLCARELEILERLGQPAGRRHGRIRLGRSTE
jgi:hypothetical protein